MASKEQAINVFESLIRDREAIPYLLVDQWFFDSLAEYQLEIAPLKYNELEDAFAAETSSEAIMTIGYLMSLRYLERELSRVNKINNIITKDITLNGNGDSKRMTRDELQIKMDRVSDFINKQKTSWYVN